MKDGIEIRPNGIQITKKLGTGGVSYFYYVDEDKAPWDYLCNARQHADSLRNANNTNGQRN
jgi:hypothetical protein